MAFHQSWSKIYFYIYVAYTFVYDGVKFSSEEKIKGIQLPIKLRTGLIKAGAFIFPAFPALCPEWLSLSICIDLQKMKLKEIENDPDYQPLMWLHTRWTGHLRFKGGHVHQQSNGKRSSCQGFSSFSSWRVITALFQIRDWSIGLICGQQSNFNTRLCTDRWGQPLIKGQFTLGAMGMKLRQLPLFVSTTIQSEEKIMQNSQNERKVALFWLVSDKAFKCLITQQWLAHNALVGRETQCKGVTFYLMFNFILSFTVWLFSMTPAESILFGVKKQKLK